MGLDTFLRKHDVQTWRIEVLVDCGAIKILRDGAEIPLKRGIKTHVDVDDKVRITDPLSTKCKKAIERKVETDSRDYAWVPGTSKFDKAMAALIDNKPQTIRIKDASVGTLSAFTKLFKNSALITHPIRHVALGSHANDEGQLKLPLTGGTGKFIDWEDLEAAIKSKSLLLEHQSFQPRPLKNGVPVAYELLIRGCRIGTEIVFLKKLREAMGGRIVVIAPKYFDAVTFQSVNPKGWVEYMDYSFRATSPTELKTHDAVVNALMGANHTLIDGNPVDKKKWVAWVPKNPQAKYEQEEFTTVKSAVTGKVASVPRKFRYQAREWLPKDEPLAMDKKKTRDADRLKVLKPLLAQRPEMQASHPYPMYVRLGYKSFDEFIDGWTWRFLPKNKAADEVKFNAVRHEYTVIQPITEVKTGVLIVNFYPISKRDKVIENLRPDDARLYTTVSSITP